MVVVGGGDIEACQKCNSLCFLSDDTFHCVSVSGCFEALHTSLLPHLLFFLFFFSGEPFDTVRKSTFPAGV